jgi:hypothetical protein
MSLGSSRVFQDFPKLKIIVSHGGGPVPYQVGRWRAERLHPVMAKNIPLAETFDASLRRLYYDSVIHAKDSLAMPIKLVGSDRVREDGGLVSFKLRVNEGPVSPSTPRLIQPPLELARKGTFLGSEVWSAQVPAEATARSAPSSIRRTIPFEDVDSAYRNPPSLATPSEEERRPRH